MMFDIVKLGSGILKKGLALWSGEAQFGAEPDAIEPLDNGDVYQGLGFTSLPYPADDDGYAEGVCIRGAAGKDVSWIGARDTRTAAIVGNLKGGDTCIHSTGPQQAAQVQCKEDKRQVLMATKSRNGKTMLVMLDGDTNKFQTVLSGMVFEMNADNKSISMTNGQASILMSGNTIQLNGDVVISQPVAGPASSVKVTAELVKIAAALSSLPVPPVPPYVAPPLPNLIAAPGITVGG